MLECKHHVQSCSSLIVQVHKLQYLGGLESPKCFPLLVDFIKYQLKLVRWIFLQWHELILLLCPVEIKPVLLNNNFQLPWQGSHKLNAKSPYGVSIKSDQILYRLLAIDSLFKCETFDNLQKHGSWVAVFSWKHWVAKHFENSPEFQISFTMFSATSLSSVSLDYFLSSLKHLVLCDLNL
jgi:hypothetical protein